jgi:peptidoglycan/xylan/chitin deacetylase (PgdA/CDA1 family)
MFHLLRLLITVMVLFPPLPLPARAGSLNGSFSAPILLYHRFGPIVADRMTVTTSAFASQLKSLQDGGYTVIPLRQLVAYFRGEGPVPPSRSVVITADDGHRSVYTEMFPLVKRLRIPVTLFIYPSAISNASYVLTWDQLKEMHGSGLFDVQSHTYWHPDFRKEMKRLAPSEYKKFVEMQLAKSKEKLQESFNSRVDMLAWPFGIYDKELIRQAAQSGYIAAFTMERRPARSSDELMALPRYLITNEDTGKRFERLLSGR